MPEQAQEEALDDDIRALVMAAPPLTDEKRALITTLLTQEAPTAAATAIGA